MYAISCLQHEYAGWYYKVSFSRRAEPFERRFYVKSHGGKAKALKLTL